MADANVQTQAVDSSTGLAVLVNRKMRDMGDGTFAEVVAGGTGATGADQIQGSVAAGVADSGNPVKAGGVYNSAPPTYLTGQRSDLQTDSRGTLHVGLYDASGSSFSTAAAPADGLSNAVTSIPVFARGYIFNGTSWDRQAKASATSRIPSAAATTNATSAKASAGTVYTIDAMNTTAAVKYLKLYNKASAPTVGTDTPVRTIALPPSNATYRIQFPSGYYFSTGIAYALTGAAADADATALAAGDVVGLNIDYS